MKLTNRILLNVLFSTVAFSAYAGSNWDKTKAWGTTVTNNKKEISKAAGYATAGALMMYLASNERVKAYAHKTSSAISNYSKAKYNAIVNYWRSLGKTKKAVAGTLATAAAVTAYLYFDAPGAQKIKNSFKKRASEQVS